MVPEFDKTARAVKQARTLLAATPRWPALYCFYNHFDSRTLPQLRTHEPTTLGVGLAYAREVLELLTLQTPWHQLVCSNGQESFDLLGEVAEFLFDLPGQGWDTQPQDGGQDSHRAWVNGVDQVRDPALIARVLIGRVRNL